MADNEFRDPEEISGSSDRERYLILFVFGAYAGTLISMVPPLVVALPFSDPFTTYVTEMWSAPEVFFTDSLVLLAFCLFTGAIALIGGRAWFYYRG